MAGDLKRVGVVFTADGVRDFKASLAEVNASINENYAAYKLAQSQWDASTKSSDKLRDKQKFLAQQTADYSTKVETLTAELKQMENAENRDEAAIQKKKAQLEQAQTQLNRYQKQLETVTKELESGAAKLRDYGQALESAGDKMEKAGKTMTTHVTAPIVAAGGAAVKTAADFDTSMSKVAAVSGATGEDLDQLRGKAREMGAETKFSATEAADAMNYMAMAGWKTSDMLDGIEGIMDLAAASGEDLAKTSDIVTDALTAFGLQASDSSHFADILAAASSNANTNVSLMGETFKYVAPIAGALGYSAEDTAEAIGLMANSGIKGSQAGTSLRTILNSLQGEVEIVGDNLEKTTIQTTNADGSMRELGDILTDVRAAFSQLTESEAAQTAESLVGKNAMSGFLALMQAAPADIEKLNGAISDCDGTAAAMADTMQDNLSGQWTILMSQLQELAISFGEILMPAIRGVVTHLQKVVNALNKMSPQAKTVLTIILAIVAAIGPLLIVIGGVTKGIGSLMNLSADLMLKLPQIQTMVSGMVTSMQGALSSFFSFLLTNPIVLVIAGIVAAITLLYQNCEWFRDGVNGILQAIGEKLTEIWNGISEILSAAWETIKGVWDDLSESVTGSIEGVKTSFAGFLEYVRPAVEIAFEVIRNVITTVMNVVGNTVKTVLSVMSTVFTTTFKVIAEVVKNVMEQIRIIIDTVLNVIRIIFDTVFGVIRGIVETVTALIHGDIDGAMEGIRSIIETVLEGVYKTFETIFKGALEIVSTNIETIKTTIDTALNAAWKIVTDVLEGIKKSFSDILEGAYKIVSDVIERIKGVFNFEWSLPKLKLPHVTISGEFSLMPLKVPKFDISWYAKGGILNHPTIFGMNGSKLMGGGEAGPEAILPISELKKYIQEANAEQTDRIVAAFKKAMIEVFRELRPGVYLDDERIGEMLKQFIREEIFES